jgi:hypothetical protein
MNKTMGLKVIASRSPLMALPPYQISRRYIKQYKTYWWGTHRQAGWLSNKPTYTIFEKYVKQYLQDTEWWGLDWINVPEDRESWWAIVN